LACGTASNAKSFSALRRSLPRIAELRTTNRSNLPLGARRRYGDLNWTPFGDSLKPRLKGVTPCRFSMSAPVGRWCDGWFGRTYCSPSFYSITNPSLAVCRLLLFVRKASISPASELAAGAGELQAGRRSRSSHIPIVRPVDVPRRAVTQGPDAGRFRQL